MCRGNRKSDVTTMVTYSHASTPLGQSERAYYLSYFIIRYNHLRRGDYSGKTNFENGRLALCHVSEEKMVSQQILITVMTRIGVDKSTDHAKPHSICFFTTMSKITKEIFVNTCSQLKTPTPTWKCTRWIMQMSSLCPSDLPFKNFFKLAQHAEAIRKKCLGKE